MIFIIKKLKLFSLLLLPIAILFNFISSKFPYIVEEYYSNKINKFTVQILSKITSIIPFSLYELSMYLIVISLIIFIILFVFIAFRHRDYLILFIKNSLLNILSILSIGYFLFIILWGLNYNRIPLEVTLLNQYNLNNNPKVNSILHTDDDLAVLYKYLIDNTNKTRELVLEENSGIMKANSNYKKIIKRAQLGL